MKPFVVLNFKAYAESSGEGGVALAKAAFEVAKKTRKANIVVCPQFPQLELIAKKFRAPNFLVFSQYADAVNAGAYTGSAPLESLKASGCTGTLLNHSEKQVSFEHARFVIEKANASGMKTVLCADSVAKGVLFAQLQPWAVAVEPPELIGSGISVSSARPEVVANAVEQIKRLNSRILVLVGAGVSNAQDIEKSIELGAEGVLLASAFVKSKSPKKLLEEMVSVL